jgi:Protein of unknown function (DUF1553)/Protein of unknown function (DUF1549)/Planctomycete cytochrome C
LASPGSRSKNRGKGWLVSFGLAFLALVANATTPSPAADDDFFENRIRPLLVARCQGCHATATGKTSGGLALDSRQGWQTGGDSGAAIVPGDSDASLLLRAVKHADGVSAMPPEDAGPALTPGEIDDLATWISSGAADPRVLEARLGGMNREAAASWWSFRSPVAAIPPEVFDAGLVANDIDRFIVAGLESSGLKPAALADRRTLLRRVTFDLTGLPPTPEELRDFLEDTAADAWERVIDRLLASSAYGERWGRHWLDVARYADTAGDGADYPVREAGSYRDWVIRAFNADMPYDAFLARQIAGDILAREAPPGDYADLVTATGFLAVGKRYGYAPNTDFQHLDFADCIDSLGRSVLGLSLGCARCHDHKYDPVTAPDYYALYGILQSTSWAFPGGEEQKRPANFPALVPPEEAARLDREKAETLAALDRELAERTREKMDLEGTTFAGGVDLDLEAQEIGKGPNVKPWLSAGPNAVLEEAQSPWRHVHPEGTRGVRVGTGAPNEGVRHTFDDKLMAAAGPLHVCFDFRTIPSAGLDQPTGACRFYIGRGVIESTALDLSATQRELAVRDGDGWRVVTPLEPERWYHVSVTLDHATKTGHGSITPFPADGAPPEPIPLTDLKLPDGWDGVIDTFICDGLGAVGGPATIRDIDNVGRQGMPFPLPGAPPAEKPQPPADAAERVALLGKEIEAVAARRKAIADMPAYPLAYGVSEGTPTDARIQARGEPEKPGAEAPRRFLEILGGDTLADPAAGSGRRDLASWLTRRENPLTARVFVNRIWQWHFGRGIVATTSDFGVRGERPSHPELLDWLAVRFMESGWRVKDLHRLILRSRTYRQSADGDAGGIAADPEHRLLGRFPRRPLDAETLRDALLATSGLLDTSPPPPHPFPAVDTWAFTIHQPFHGQYDSDRRSVYLMIQRNRRHPFLALFDAADPNQSVAVRDATITPTQSLFLMNSPLVHRAAEAFADNVLAAAGEGDARLRLAAELAWGRQADDAELSGMHDFLAQVAEQSPKLSERAAWGALARVLLTANPFLFVD